MPRIHMTLLFTAALTSLSACCGVAGTSVVQCRAGDGADVVTIQTRGVEIRNVPGCRGLSLGWRRATLVYPAGTLAGPLPRRAPGWCLLPSVAPLFVENTGTGFDLAFEPSFWGFSAGRYSRASARLPLDSSAVLQVLTRAAAGPHFSYATTP